MSLQHTVLESNSYEYACKEIRRRGTEKFGPSGYSRIIFANGVFDCLHLGHLKLIKECYRLAGPKGAVVIGVNSDESVKRNKGTNRPIIDEVTRCTLLIFMKPVEHVVMFEEDTPLALIECLKPDLIVKGSDYTNKNVVGSHVSPVHFVESDGTSTTSIIEKIRNA